jgi:hypothetical protein
MQLLLLDRSARSSALGQSSTCHTSTSAAAQTTGCTTLCMPHLQFREVVQELHHPVRLLLLSCHLHERSRSCRRMWESWIKHCFTSAAACSHSHRPPTGASQMTKL